MNAKNTADAPPAGEPSFEDALERLETIVDELEAGTLTLEQSLRHYEEGMKLSKRLSKQLDEAEKAIEKLIESGDESGPEETAGGETQGGRKRRKPSTQPIELELPGPGDTELPF